MRLVRSAISLPWWVVATISATHCSCNCGKFYSSHPLITSKVPLGDRNGRRVYLHCKLHCIAVACTTVSTKYGTRTIPNELSGAVECVKGKRTRVPDAVCLHRMSSALWTGRHQGAHYSLSEAPHNPVQGERTRKRARRARKLKVKIVNVDLALSDFRVQFISLVCYVNWCFVRQT